MVRVRGAWCWVLGAGCWVLGAGCWVLRAMLVHRAPSHRTPHPAPAPRTPHREPGTQHPHPAPCTQHQAPFFVRIIVAARRGRNPPRGCPDAALARRFASANRNGGRPTFARATVGEVPLISSSRFRMETTARVEL